MNEIERMLDLMSRPPEPAAEVVTLDRSVVVQLLAEREHKGPLDPVVTYLRAELAQPKVELWAMHSVGPGEIYPALDREHAEKMVADMRECEQSEKQRLIDKKCPSLEHWCDWVVNIVPSPWEPDEHFQELASQTLDEEKGARAGWAKADDDRTKLLDAVSHALDYCTPEKLRDLGDVGLIDVLTLLADAVSDVLAEEVARKKRLEELEERLAKAVKP